MLINYKSKSLFKDNSASKKPPTANNTVLNTPTADPSLIYTLLTDQTVMTTPISATSSSVQTSCCLRDNSEYRVAYQRLPPITCHSPGTMQWTANTACRRWVQCHTLAVVSSLNIPSTLHTYSHSHIYSYSHTHSQAHTHLNCSAQSCGCIIPPFLPSI